MTRKARAVPAKPAAAVKSGRGRQPIELAPDVLAKAKKRWWAGDSREEIAAEAGVGLSTLYRIAKQQHWPKEAVQP